MIFSTKSQRHVDQMTEIYRLTLSLLVVLTSDPSYKVRKFPPNKITELSCPQRYKHYATMQESVRKDIERTFGVLQARFRILALPCKLWHRDAMHSIMNACIILHNMIVEDEWSTDGLDNQHLFDNPAVIPLVRRPEPQVSDLMRRSNEMRDRSQHIQLRNDLAAHLWSLLGTQQSE